MQVVVMIADGAVQEILTNDADIQVCMVDYDIDPHSDGAVKIEGVRANVMNTQDVYSNDPERVAAIMKEVESQT